MQLFRLLPLPLALLALGATVARSAEPRFDVVVRGGTVYDGNGGTP